MLKGIERDQDSNASDCLLTEALPGVDREEGKA